MVVTAEPEPSYSRHARVAYIAGALTSAPDIDRARKFYEQLAEACRTAGWTAYLPHERTDPARHPDVTPEAVFEMDRELVEACDVMVADVGIPSAGVGGELVLAWKAATPIIAVSHRDQVVSRFVLGLLSVAGATVIKYGDQLTCATQVGDELRSRDPQDLDPGRL